MFIVGRIWRGRREKPTMEGLKEYANMQLIMTHPVLAKKDEHECGRMVFLMVFVGRLTIVKSVMPRTYY